MEKTSSVKDSILSDSVLLYCLFGIILSAIYGIILSPIITMPKGICIHNANLDFQLFLSVLEQKNIFDYLRWMVPFSILCFSFLFLFVQHNFLDRMLEELSIPNKQGGVLKITFFKVCPWIGILLLSLLASIWLPFTLHIWPAVLLIFLIILALSLGVILVIIFRMRFFLFGVIVLLVSACLESVMIAAYLGIRKV